MHVRACLIPGQKGSGDLEEDSEVRPPGTPNQLNRLCRVWSCAAVLLIAMPSFTGHDTAFRMCFHRLPSLRPCRSVVFLPFYLFSLTKTPPLGCVSAAFPRLRHRLSLVLSLPSPR